MSSVPSSKKEVKDLNLSSSSSPPDKSNSFEKSNSFSQEEEPRKKQSTTSKGKKTTEAIAQDEISKMISSLMDNGVVQEKRIKQLTKENEEMKKENEGMKQELAQLKKDQLEMGSYKDKFNDIMFTYSQKEQEIENLQTKLKKKSADIDKLKKEVDKIKIMKREIQEKDKIMEQITQEMDHIKNLPKEEQVLLAEQKAQKAEEEKEKIDKKLYEQIAKFNTAIEDYNKLTAAFDNYKKENESQKTAMLSKVKECEENTEKYKNDLLKATNNYIEIQTKLNNSLSLINKLQTENESFRTESSNLKREMNKLVEEMKENANQSSISGVSSDLFKEIYSENISMCYSNDFSLSFQDVVNDILVNFSSIVPSCFTGNDSSQPLTFSQETLKGIYYVLYTRALDSRTKGSELTKFLSLNPEDFSNEIVNQITLELYSKNLVSSGLGSKELGEKALSKLTSLQLGEEITQGIKDLVSKKTEKKKQLLFAGLKALVEKCVSTIKDGTIELQKKKLFRFSSFIGEGISIVKGGLVVDNTKLTDLTAEYLIYLIKYPKEKIVKIQFNGDFVYEKIKEKMIIQILFSVLSFIPNILSFSITSCQNITESILNVLLFIIKNLKSIKILNLENNKLTDSQLKIVCEEIKDNKTIVALFLGKNNFQSSGGLYLADLLSTNKTIERLFLGNNQITSSGFSGLLTILTNTSHKVNCLDLSNNNFSNNDFEELSSFLMKNPPLMTLNLSGNKMEMQSAVELGAALNNVHNIKTLNLSNMSIASEAIPNLLKSLCVEEIILDDNPIGEIGLIMLSKALIKNKTVKKISLKNADLSSIGLQHLLISLQGNTTITEIHIENNAIDENGLTTALTLTKGKKFKIFMSKIPNINTDPNSNSENVVLV